MPSRLVRILIWASGTLGHVMRQVGSDNYTSSSLASPLLSRASADPTDFSWVKRWAAIGDSFTAGIGSGEQTGTYLSDNWKCSRYTYAWPEIVNHGLGPSVSDFQFKACSGDRSEGIYKQAQDLSGSLDLVMMTAGGNDLCLAAMIKDCVFLPWRGADACQSIINKAQENIDTILKPNIQSILDALDSKMNDDSILVYNGYAPFFNTDNEDCSDPSKQAWAIREWWWVSYWLSTPLPLDIPLRTQFNTLVDNINKALKEVVKANDGQKKYRMTFSDWSEWPSIVDGQMCSPSSDGHYPDVNQPDMQFFKPNTYWVFTNIHDQLKREVDNSTLSVADLTDRERIEQDYIREMRRRYPNDEDLYDSLVYKSVNPGAAALHRLDARAPSPPNCPGDGGPQVPLGLGLPDSFGENFHPNEKGHETIAASSLENLVYMRAKVLGQDSCRAKVDEFTCWAAVPFSPAEYRPYNSWERVDILYKQFCDTDVNVPDGVVNWGFTKKYYQGTPEEVDFVVNLSNGASKFDRQLCKETFEHIINGCDHPDDGNPLNYKFGGKWKRGDYEYSINPSWQRRLVTRLDGECNSHYHVGASTYDLSGRGWAGWDFGQETILPAIKGCLGLGITGWDFHYCTKDSECEQWGWDWLLTFHTPVFVKARCFANLKVVRAAGGYTHEYNKPYEKFGCAGSDR